MASTEQGPGAGRTGRGSQHRVRRRLSVAAAGTAFGAGLRGTGRGLPSHLRLTLAKLLHFLGLSIPIYKTGLKQPHLAVSRWV